MTDAVVYVRISDDREGQGLGVARQEKDCRALCKRKRFRVAEVITDNDRSAYSGKRRPGYERLLDGLKTGRWQAVVAWHPDRLQRSPKELETFIDVIEASGCQVVTVMAGEYDLSTATGRMTARVVGAVARHESEQKSERIRRKHKQLAEDGHQVGGGPRPFGYLPDRETLHPAESALVREAARAVLDGMSLSGIAADWQARGVPTVTGVRWSPSVIRGVLLSPRAAGFRVHAGKRYRGQWEPLFDEVTWNRLRARLCAPERRCNVSPRTYLLTGGLAFCGLCGTALSARPREDGTRTYACITDRGGCGKIRVVSVPFEDDIKDRILGRIEGGKLPQPDPETGVPQLLVEIETAEAAQAELADDYYVHRSISKAQFQSASSALGARLGDLRGKVGKLERVEPATLDRQAVMVLLSPEVTPRQRAIVETMTERITVNPATRGRGFYDETRVVVTWRK